MRLDFVSYEAFSCGSDDGAIPMEIADRSGPFRELGDDLPASGRRPDKDGGIPACRRRKNRQECLYHPSRVLFGRFRQLVYLFEEVDDFHAADGGGVVVEAQDGRGLEDHALPTSRSFTA